MVVTAEREPKQLGKAEHTWKCPECKEDRDPFEACCESCYEFRPGLTRKQEALCVALEPDADALLAWERHWKNGVSDSVLESTIATILEGQVIDGCSGVDAPICWRVDENRKSGFWFGKEKPPARGKPELSGKLLLKEVRSLFRLTKPEETAPQESKPKPKKRKQPATKEAASPAIQLIPLEQIEPSPFQPRQHFDEAKLEALAESLKRHGQVQPCLVRRVDDHFELVAGERRLRAADIAGLKSLECKVAELTDAEAAEICGRENEDREDFNPLERIRWFKTLLDNKVYPTQTALAKSRGMTQGAMSNQLRLLQLPEQILDLISQEILPVTHARFLLPFADVPNFIDEICEYLDEDGLGTVSDWEHDVLVAARDVSRHLVGWGWITGVGHREACLSKKEREAPSLDVREVGNFGKRAFNVKLWEQMQEAGEKRRQKRQDGQDSTPKQQVDETPQQKAKRQSEALQKKIRIWKSEWLQALIAKHIHDASPELIFRWLFAFSLKQNTNWRNDAAAQVAKSEGHKLKRQGHDVDWFASLGDLDSDQLQQLAKSTLAMWCQQDAEKPWTSGLDHRTVDALAEELGIVLESAWDEWGVKSDFLRLHTKDQLAELVKFWKLGKNKHVQNAKTRDDLISAIVSAARETTTPIPASVLKAKA